MFFYFNICWKLSVVRWNTWFFGMANPTDINRFRSHTRQLVHVYQAKTYSMLAYFNTKNTDSDRYDRFLIIKWITYIYATQLIIFFFLRYHSCYISHCSILQKQLTRTKIISFCILSYNHFIFISNFFYLLLFLEKLWFWFDIMLL